MDDDQQFCLRWNNHQSTLVSVFDTLLESGTLVDCTLAAEGKFLKAHKVVLSACSPYFAALLSQQYDKHPIFILKDVKFQELRAMMDYMYRGEVNISQDQLSALLKAAESLQIKGLSDSRGAQKPQTLEQKQQLGVPIVKIPTTSGYTLESKKIRHAGGIGLTSLDSQDLPISRESSSSPTSRKRKKIRRRSVENIPTEPQEHSNSSSHSVHINSTAPTVTSTAITSVSTNVSTPSSSTSSTVTAVTGNIIPITAISGTKKTESVANAKLENMEREIDDNGDNRDEIDKLIVSGKKDQNTKQRKLQQPGETNETSNTDNTEMLIEPKNEYDDGNETVEDLTLDDEELEDLEQAGPSHGGGEGSSQGYAQWQVDRSQEEMFITTQEAAVAQQRDPQDLRTSFITSSSSSFKPEITVRKLYKHCTIGMRCVGCLSPNSSTKMQQTLTNSFDVNNTPTTMMMISQSPILPSSSSSCTPISDTRVTATASSSPLSTLQQNQQSSSVLTSNSSIFHNICFTPKRISVMQFDCIYCSFSCTWKYDLKLHLRQKHGVHKKI